MSLMVDLLRMSLRVGRMMVRYTWVKRLRLRLSKLMLTVIISLWRLRLM